MRNSLREHLSIKRIRSRLADLFFNLSTVILVFCGLVSFIAFAEGKFDFFPTIFFGIAAALIVTAIGRDRGPNGTFTSVQYLSVDSLCKEIQRARHHVWIVDIWMHILLDSTENLEKFEHAVKHACIQNGVDIKVIVAMPECDTAKKRAEHLVRENNDEFQNKTADDITKRMHVYVACLDSLRSAVINEMRLTKSPAVGLKFDVRIADDCPHFAIYRVDNKVCWNFYPDWKLHLDEPFYVTNVRKSDSFSEFLSLYFKHKWDDPHTMIIEKYFESVDAMKSGVAAINGPLIQISQTVTQP